MPMYTDLQWIERLAEELKEADLLQRVVNEEGGTQLVTQKFRVFIYFPHTERIKEEVGEDMIHIDIDVLRSSYEKIVRRIKGLCGLGERIYARNTVVARVDKKVTEDFLVEHHLQGSMTGKYRYGLFYKGELVSIAVFSGGRIMRNISDSFRSFELIRFCHKSDCLVIGGISKLIKAFVQDFKPNDIMTYADRDWSLQSSLESIGFKEEGITESQLFLIKDGVRYSYSVGIESYDYIVKNKGSIKLKLYL